MKKILIDWLKAFALALGGFLAVTLSTIFITYSYNIITMYSVRYYIALVAPVVLIALVIFLIIRAIVHYIKKKA